MSELCLLPDNEMDAVLEHPKVALHLKGAATRKGGGGKVRWGGDVEAEKGHVHGPCQANVLASIYFLFVFSSFFCASCIGILF